jgi:hypothetical protein
MLLQLIQGAAFGASLGAIFDMLEPDEEASDNPGPVGGPTGGPSTAPSLGPILGPPGGGSMPFTAGPSLGPRISVEPITTPPGAAFPGSAFFGISTPFFYWPVHLRPFYGSVRLVCRREEKRNGDEVLVCERARPKRPVAWGPPAAWLF